MATVDVRSNSEIVEILSTAGVQKSQLRIDKLFVKSMLGGVFLSFAGLFLLTVGGGAAPLAQSLGPGILRMVQAAVFPIGLVLIVVTNAELFTGNTMIFTISTLDRRTKWFHLIVSWAVSYIGNLAGILFCQGILIYYAGLLTDEPYRSYAIKVAETKGNTQWHQMFLRGIAGNWLVCLAVWMAMGARELVSKIVTIYLPIWLFVSVGYEHSIANMVTVQLGMMLGANLSVGNYIANVLIPATLGNILGGAFFVGFVHWYIHSAKTSCKYSTTNAESPNTNCHCGSKSPQDKNQVEEFKL